MITYKNPHIYPKKLEEEIRNCKFIPRKCCKGEHLKLYHKYWNPIYEGYLKVEHIDIIKHIENYFIKFDNSKLYASVPYPLDDMESTYELLRNYDNIDKLSIINSNKSYTGAEIKFWFVANRIDLTSEKYNGFVPFLIPQSKNVIVDNKFYFVINDNSRRQKFQIIADRSKQ